MNKLVITEKPSVGMSIASVLGCRQHEDGYMSGSGYIVTWCLGHLAGLADAELYDEKYASWQIANLPILPELWRYAVPQEKKNQFQTVRGLMNREDVSEVINACDAGREGELIFRNMYLLANCQKPMKRLWISSMEDEAIRQGFAGLRDGADFDGLYQSALCRSKADWLVGINATRLYSVLYHRTLKVGRVVSPTLSMLVQREAEISAFVPEAYYAVQLACDGFSAYSERMSKAEAEALAGDCGETLSIRSVRREEHTEKAPALFDLTTLQREANRRLGYTAQQTLDYLQSLYENKLVTYPRTDSRSLPDEMEKLVPGMVEAAVKISDLPAPDSVCAGQVCDSRRVTDHHAIVPTAGAEGCKPDELPAGERDLLFLICLGLLRAVSGEYRYAAVEVESGSGGHVFKSKGREIIDLGWKRYESPERMTELPEMREGAELIVRSVSVKAGKTAPPKHMTEDTLLSAMENAGSKEAPEEAERRGLGTPATRAAMIEKLIASGYAERRKNKSRVYLVPTQIGSSLITVLPEELQSPLLTAEWEQKLKQVERGELDADIFLAEIADMVKALVDEYEPVDSTEVLFPHKREVIGKCPRCGGNVTVSKKGYFCERRDCHFALWLDNRFLAKWKIDLTKSMARSLLRTGQVRLNGLYSEKSGRDFDAVMVMEDNGKQLRYRLQFGCQPEEQTTEQALQTIGFSFGDLSLC